VARLTLAVLVAVAIVSPRASAQAVSEPAILQMFEARWDTIEDRMADIFQVGYGKMWLPPPNRAEGGQSVGYDLFDRFEMGGPRNETLYGTETGLKSSIAAAHGASVKVYSDLIPNHNGFSNKNTPGFQVAGGYPGFVLQYGSDQYGDFHNPAISYTTDSINGSLFGLLDIAQEKNHQMIRHPITASTPGSDTIPAGTIRNKPDPNNARFYTDQGLGGVTLNNPLTGGSFTQYSFNLDSPLAGDPISENATGLMMRNMQYMLQVIGVDGFRIDAARHMHSWVFNYLDNAVFRASGKTNLDGSIAPVYMFSEVADGFAPNVQSYIRRDLPNKLAISPSETDVKGNRDALDFPLFYKMIDNLSSNGTQNNWHGIRGASMDNHDRPGGTEVWHSDGSQGVTFVDSHDEHGDGQGNPRRPDLYKVGYAYTLMKPGNAIVYMNAKEFGEGRTFPYDIGGSSYSLSNDALGGFHGEHIAELVEIRNSHGRGDFKERWLDDAFNPNGFSNVYIYERSESAIVALNSRNDSVQQTRNGVQTDFEPGSVLVELTGNADDQDVDPVATPLTQKGLIRSTLKVDATGKINVTIPASGGHGRGYLIYGLATPQGALSVSNVSQVLEGIPTPTQATNGTARLADIDVITSDTFTVQLNTTPVSLQDPDSANPQNLIRDVHADGDHAMIRMDDNLDINGLPGVSNTDLTSAGYGFEDFTTTYSPGYVWSGGMNVGTGSGTFAQEIDATGLSEGRHYVTVRAFRHRDDDTDGDGGPAVFTDFKRSIYVDRLAPQSELVSYDPFASAPGNPNNRDFIVRSVDQTADSVHILLDLPANLSEAQILAEADNDNRAGYYDRDMFIRGATVNYGNHVATIVTYEPTGNYSIERVPGLFTQTNLRGRGFGDMNFSNSYVVGDIISNVGSVEDVLYSQNAKFSSAFDVNGDGLGDNRDLFLLDVELLAGGASNAVLDAYTGLLLKRGDLNASATTNSLDVTALYNIIDNGTVDPNVLWTMDLDANGIVNIADAATMIIELLRTSLGDFTLDGVVDVSDWVLVQKLAGAGLTNAMFTQGDADFDRDVDSADVALWQQNYGFVRQPLRPAGSGGAAAVPEPSTFVFGLWLIGLAAIARRSRSRNEPDASAFRLMRIATGR
jgi:glycosidase